MFIVLLFWENYSPWISFVYYYSIFKFFFMEFLIIFTHFLLVYVVFPPPDSIIANFSVDSLGPPAAALSWNVYCSAIILRLAFKSFPCWTVFWMPSLPFSWYLLCVSEDGLVYAEITTTLNLGGSEPKFSLVIQRTRPPQTVYIVLDSPKTQVQ